MVPFIKMHGLGNDFVILDGRDGLEVPSEEAVRRICHRRQGVGCDQLLYVTSETRTGDGAADAVMVVYNSDGSVSAACGNGTRCVAGWLAEGRERLRLRVQERILEAHHVDGQWSVDMGEISHHWEAVPLAFEADTCALPVACEGFAEPCGVGVGNPHMVFAVADAEAVDDEVLTRVGGALEHHGLFPARCNVSFISRIADDEGRHRQRVWERGVGITPACGSGACAGAYALTRMLGLVEESVDVLMDGGVLSIELDAQNHGHMRGAIAYAYRGVLGASLWT